jgi:hypothetical protein
MLDMVCFQFERIGPIKGARYQLLWNNDSLIFRRPYKLSEVEGALI